ncbi:hypothetical protein LTR70_000254 [Exophiala xenobiotica]|nr:hypothetical protein LTR70_000254 [Exophiala xenobiotica]
MPPASRGPLPRLALNLRCRRIRPPTCRNASISAPEGPRSFGKRMRAERLRARNNPASPPSTPTSTVPEAPVPTGPTWSQRQRARFTPKFLRDRPYLRSWMFSFLITVPISGFILTHLPLEPRRVTGPSMRPTINPGCTSDDDTTYSPTWVLVQNWMSGRYQDTRRRIDQGESIRTKYDRGQLIVYHTPHDPDKVALKRIVALAGDTVIPLPGYNGDNSPNPEPVVIPYNHLWVEGDINDRKKSVDSNYFGPISQHLVKGKVIAMWSPWWNIFSIRSPDTNTNPNHDINNDPSTSTETDVDTKSPDTSTQPSPSPTPPPTWSIRHAARVTRNALPSAQADPNTVDSVRPFEAEVGSRTLQLLSTQPLRIEQQFHGDEAYRLQVLQTYQRGKQVARSHYDPETRDRARLILKELERVIGRDALKEASKIKSSSGKTKRVRGRKPGEEEEDLFMNWEGGKFTDEFVDVVPREDEREDERRARARPAKAALKEMLEHKKMYGEMIDKEFEQRDKIKEALAG